MMVCPECGRKPPKGGFCEYCGIPLVDMPEPMSPKQTEEDRAACQRGEPTLEYDRICKLFEQTNGIMRFRFNPAGGGERVESVSVAFANPDCPKTLGFNIRHADRQMEHLVQFPPQAAGLQSWDVRITYYSAQRKHALAGQLQVFVKPIESRKRGGDNYNIHMDTIVKNVGHANDVNVYRQNVHGLDRIMDAADPFGEMDRLAESSARDWVNVPLSDDSEVVSLPQMPAGAVAEAITLDFGDRRLHFFSKRTVKFGRRREDNDISLRPASACDEAEMMPYRIVSREHCFFEQAGEKVVLSDGKRDSLGVVSPSSGGTFWNDGNLQSQLSLAVGTTGVVSFGKPSCAHGLSLDVKVCSPERACATCPHSNIRWCGEGRHPSLLLTRRDGIPERFVALWSCFCLGEADPSFESVIVFRKDGAFAYRAGSRSGWLVPGTTIRTDFGPITIS